jgi:4-nitrophenyl phosphatase
MTVALEMRDVVTVRQQSIAAKRASWAIFDLDGTLLRGRDPVSGAVQLLQHFAGRFAIVSNNSTHSEVDLSADLRSAGLAVAPDRLLLAGTMAVELIARDYGGARVLLVGNTHLSQIATSAGLELVEERADLVLLARDDRFHYGKLARVANEILRGALLIATNADNVHPGEDGQIVPETGALLRAVVACATPHHLRIVGKPEPALLEEAIKRLGVRPADCVMIGDNPDTDGAGAERCGMPSLLLGRDFVSLDALARNIAVGA